LIDTPIQMLSCHGKLGPSSAHAFRGYLERMLRARSHHAEKFFDRLDRHFLVKEITHTVNEDQSWLFFDLAVAKTESAQACRPPVDDTQG
jgi:hypothetical protein